MSSFSVREEPDGLILRLEDSVALNDFRSSAFRDSVYELVLEHEGVRLAIDLGSIDDFLSSSGIATLVGLRRRVDAQGGKLVLFQARPNLLESLRITHLLDYFTFASDEAAALALLRPLPAV